MDRELDISEAELLDDLLRLTARRALQPGEFTATQLAARGRLTHAAAIGRIEELMAAGLIEEVEPAWVGGHRSRAYRKVSRGER